MNNLTITKLDSIEDNKAKKFEQLDFQNVKVPGGKNSNRSRRIDFNAENA